MILRSILLWTILCSSLTATLGFWGIPSIDDIVARLTEDLDEDLPDTQPECTQSDTDDDCNLNEIMLQLAHLYVTSPERIIMLLTADNVKSMCFDVSRGVTHINTTLSNCKHLSPDNLFLKLYQGLEYFHSFICARNDRWGKKHINDYNKCIRELREDLMDCEGPPDWFERKNDTIVCQYYNNIVNCNYIKAAMLCGLTPALLLRTFSAEIMKRVVVYKCKLSRSLPYVEDPMPGTASLLSPTVYSCYCCIFFILACYILINKR